MNKYSLPLAGIMMLISAGVSANIISPEAALDRAELSSGAFKIRSSSSSVSLINTVYTDLYLPAVYEFSDGKGNILFISASDLAYPVLGYIEIPSSERDINPDLNYWLEEYARQIAYAESTPLTEGDVVMNSDLPSDWKFVKPMIQTEWNQMAPYNMDLPNPVYATGCVATAMAQIMNYWQYPLVGRGSNTYSYVNAYMEEVTLSMNFGEKPFDWSNMLNRYVEGEYTEQQAQAVAYLMKACGYSTNTIFSGSSGTQTERVAMALPEYFGYDSSIESLQRYNYSSSEWAYILYSQLSDVGPVLYSGLSLTGVAHAFVVDGYDGFGFFHINWGWSGLSNGYFRLDALNPPLQSTGGSTSGYNFSQGMIVNIKKGDGEMPSDPSVCLTLLGNLSAVSEGQVLTMNMSQANPGNIVNNSTSLIVPEFGICMEHQSSSQKIYKPVTEVIVGGKPDKISEMGPGSYLSEEFGVKASFDSSLADGSYKVSLVWRNALTSSDEWCEFIVSPGCHDYILLTKNNGQYIVENLPMARFEIKSAEVVSPLYMRNPCEISFSLENPTEYELTQSIIPVLYYLDGDKKVRTFEGDSQLVTMQPNENKTVNLIYSFDQKSNSFIPTPSSPRQYILGAFDFNVLLEKYYSMGEYGDSYYGDLSTVTMNRATGTPSLSLKSISIANSSTIDSDNDDIIYGVIDTSDLQLSVVLSNTGSFIATPLSATISRLSPVMAQEDIIYQKTFPGLLAVAQNEEAELSVNLHPGELSQDDIYEISISYIYQNSVNSLGNILFGKGTGIDNVSNDNKIEIGYSQNNIFISSEVAIDNVTIYNLTGEKVKDEKFKGLTSINTSIENLVPGIYIVRVTDSSNHVETVKICI